MISDLLFGFSKALYSTWVYYKPDHLLLDCGEGAATALGNGGFAIEKVLLTHGHMDHIAGLPVLLGSRNAGMGDTQKPLQIYYPRGDQFVLQMREYLQQSHQHLSYPLEWITLDANATIPLRGKRFIETFATRHSPKNLTLGYRLMEKRRRLKAEFSHFSQLDIENLARREGKTAVANLSETYHAKVLLCSGDSMPLAVEDVEHAEILLHEATLLDAAERTSQMHSTLDEAVQVAAAAHVKALVLYHISGRYRSAEVKKAALAARQKYAATFPIWILHHNRLFALDSDNSM